MTRINVYLLSCKFLDELSELKIMQCTCTTWNGFSVFSYPPKIKTVTSSLGTILGGTAAFCIDMLCSETDILTYAGLVCDHILYKKHHKYIHFSIRITILIYLVNTVFVCIICALFFLFWPLKNWGAQNMRIFFVEVLIWVLF